MNAMGHNVRNFIGAEMERDLVDAVRRLAPWIYADGLVWNGRDGDACARKHAANDER